MTESDHNAIAADKPTNSETVDTELSAMAKVSEALSSLDTKARDRIMAWAVSRFGSPVASPTLEMAKPPKSSTSGGRENQREIPGIARVTDAGELHLTVRDVKARSANDAAIRIAHVAIFVHEQLTGMESVSSKNVLVPILRRYRAYDGNTRGAIAQHRGFIREGDQLSMDLHCRQEAETYIKEILDSAVQGTWHPSAKPAKKKNSKDSGPESGAEAG